MFKELRGINALAAWHAMTQNDGYCHNPRPISDAKVFLFIPISTGIESADLDTGL
jgi:hypothetical protein